MLLSSRLGGDARDVVTVGIESDLMGIVCSCDIRNEDNESMTISIISIIIIIGANIIIRVSSVVMVIVGGGKDVVDVIVIKMIMKVNSEDERVAIRVGHARRKMGSERVLTITRGWSNTDVDIG